MMQKGSVFMHIDYRLQGSEIIEEKSFDSIHT